MGENIQKYHYDFNVMYFFHCAFIFYDTESAQQKIFPNINLQSSKQKYIVYPPPPKKSGVSPFFSSRHKEYFLYPK